MNTKSPETELQNAIKVVSNEKQNCITKKYELTRSFRSKISLLISQTPTGELRNELSELNILFETILVNDQLLSTLNYCHR